ncbi:MAG: CHASE3 domain-containing protein, partial [Chitinophagaceae bacterium]|nr:CHASE3 domain-containing protein [Chitinophagaceae bacterium]
MKPRNNYVKFTTILFIIYLLSLVFCGVFFYYRIQLLNTAIDLVSNSNRIRQKIKQVEADVNRSESAQRGFLLTDDSIFLEHWQKANSHALKAIDTIKLLVADNPDQADHAARLQEITLERLGLLKKTMEVKNSFIDNPDMKKEYLLSGKKT